jgi:hypothetical protein
MRISPASASTSASHHHRHHLLISSYPLHCGALTALQRQHAIAAPQPPLHGGPILRVSYASASFMLSCFHLFLLFATVLTLGQQ